MSQKQIATQQTKRPDLRAMLNSDAMRTQIAAALPRHLTPDRMVRVATTALLRVPRLAECDQASFFRALLDLSALGLEPDGRHAHLIPFENKRLGIVECQLIIDYKGLIALAKRSGEVKQWDVFDVCESDVFEWRNGEVEHVIDWRKPRGEAFAYYSKVILADGLVSCEVMTRADVEIVRSRSRAANSGPWVTDFGEMGKKTALRRHAKRLTLSPEFADALAADDDRRDEKPVAARVVTTAPPSPALSFLPAPAAPAAPAEESPPPIPPADEPLPTAPEPKSGEAPDDGGHGPEPSAPPPQPETAKRRLNNAAKAAGMMTQDLIRIAREQSIIGPASDRISEAEAESLLSVWPAVVAEWKKGGEPL